MLEELKEFTSAIADSQKKDFSYFRSLLTSCELRKSLKFICDNWDMFAIFYEGTLEQFQDLIKCKIESIPFEKPYRLFPELPSLIDKVELINQYKGTNKKEKMIEQLQTDHLFKIYVKDELERKDRNGIFYKINQESKSKIPFHEYIANHHQYLKSQKIDAIWQSIFTIIQGVKYIETEKQNDIDINEFQFISGIEKQRLPSLSCLGCSPFFYFGANIYNPVINSTPVVLLPAITRLRELQSQLKDEVCWLLNNHGGVILFDCVQRYRDVIPRGDKMSLQLKTLVEQSISSLIKHIHPPVDAANFTISFVPIINNPYRKGGRMGTKTVTEGSTYQNTYFQREYIEGLYVTRIKINPTIPQRLYFWINDKRPIFPLKVNKKIIVTPGRRIAKIIKKRFKQYYVPEMVNNREELKFLTPKLSYFHPGECIKPDFGVQMKVISTTNKDNTLLSQDERYSHTSLIIAKGSADYNNIQQRLRKKGFDCKIVHLFQKYKFRYTANSSVIYHNIRFDFLLEEVSHKRQYQYGGKYINIICVTPFIKLTQRNSHNRLDEDIFLNICNYFSKQYHQEPVCLWKYSPTQYQQQFYFRVTSRRQIIFLYYILNQMRQKVMFKNPLNFDKLTQEVINARFKLFYPRNQEELQKSKKALLKENLL